MRLQRPITSIAAALVAAASFVAALPAHADTYSIVALENDNHPFYGMDDSGDVVFTYYNATIACAPGPCYYTFYNGVYTGFSATPPALTYDFGISGACHGAPVGQVICSASDNGRTAAVFDTGTSNSPLYAVSGGNPPQLITTINGIAGYLAINGEGDIVFDSGYYDEWFEAIDLTTAATPEPSTLLLLATGLVGLAAFAIRRRVA